MELENNSIDETASAAQECNVPRFMELPKRKNCYLLWRTARGSTSHESKVMMQCS